VARSHKPWWTYRHLRPLWGLLLADYGRRRPFVAPILPAVFAGAIGFGRGPNLYGQGAPFGSRIAVGLGFAVAMYVFILLTFLARREAAQRKQDATRRD
jgi:hypothetical protein